MAQSYNRLALIGNLGREPEARTLPSGQLTTRLRVATSHRWTRQDGQPREETEWFDAVCYGKLAEVANTHLTKGEKLFLAGRLHTDRWQDQDGQTHSRRELVVQDLVFLGGKRPPADEPSTGEQPGEDDLPF